MDDFTITTETHVQARWILSALEEVVTWARMKFKLKKSSVLIVKKGQICSKFKLSVQGEMIPSLVDNPTKCLGKWFDDSLSNRNNIGRLQTMVQEGLKNMEKTCLAGKFKAWIFQHSILPRLLWPLTIYEVPSSTAETLEQTIIRHLRKWFGLPPSFSSTGLYTTSGQLRLPISSLVEVYKTGKACLLMTLRDSRDDKIRNACIEVLTERRWSASKAVHDAVSRLSHSDIVGSPCVGHKGLGTSHVQC